MSVMKNGIKIAGAGATALATQGQAGLVSLGMLLNTFYPVGTIYQSVNNTNPGTLMGGTWVAWGSGRVPVGVDAAQTEFNTVEKTNLASTKTHTLAETEMPGHNHVLRRDGNVGVPMGIGGGGTTGNAISGVWYDTPIYNGSICVASAGGGLAHNNLQPYITCYFFKRTA